MCHERQKLILQGYRNKTDGLWDISLHNLHPTHYNMPRSHPSNNSSTSKPHHVNNPSFYLNTPKVNRYIQKYTPMDNVIDKNRCFYERNLQF